jgi:colicin import membrane protein
MEMPAETRARIFAAADVLYQEAGRAAFPTVDAVRRSARVNMNDASTGMKEWRRVQTAQAAPVAVQVPPAVQQASAGALASLWQAAQELANESLRSAQAGWDTERNELEGLNQQMADAFEAQARELEAAQQELARVTAQLGVRDQEGQAQQSQIATLGNELASAQQSAQTAQVRAQEIEHRANNLKAELDHAHQDAARLRAELDALRKTHADEIKAVLAKTDAAQATAVQGVAQIEALRSELATVKAQAEAADQVHQEQRKQVAADLQRTNERLAKVESERDAERKDAAQANQEAAKRAGQLEAMQSQVADLNKALAASLASHSTTSAPEQPGGKGKKG